MAVFASRYARAFADVVAEFHLDAASVDKQLSDFLATVGWQPRTARSLSGPFGSLDAEDCRAGRDEGEIEAGSAGAQSAGGADQTTIVSVGARGR